MAATRKSTKHSAAKKGAAKRPSSRKKAVRKSTSKRGAKKRPASKASGLKRQAKKGLKAARGRLEGVMRVGGKTWKSLKSTTATVMEGMVEGVKDTFAGDPPRSR